MGRDKRNSGQTSRRGWHGNGYIKSTNGKMASSSKGKREVLVEHYRKLLLGTPTTNKTLSAELEEEISAWAEAIADASEREDRGSEVLKK